MRSARTRGRNNCGLRAKCVRRCAELYLRHTPSGDPFEYGSARPLDFGHCQYISSRYESSVRSGMVKLLPLGSHSTSDTAANSVSWTKAATTKLSYFWRALIADTPPSPGRNQLSGGPPDPRGIRRVPPASWGELTVTLLQGIGQGFETHEMNPALIQRSRHSFCVVTGGLMDEPRLRLAAITTFLNFTRALTNAKCPTLCTIAPQHRLRARLHHQRSELPCR